MKTYTITFKDGKILITSCEKIVMFNDDTTGLVLQNNTLYLNANEVRTVTANN